MAEIIAVVSGKGGVGKTTSTANIGTALATMGKKVLLIDCDVGLRNLDVSLGMQSRVVYDFFDVIEGKCDFKKAVIVDDNFAGLNLLSAPQTRELSEIKKEDFCNMLDKLKPYYDYIFLDCPAGTGNIFELTISVCESALVIATPEINSIRDADSVVSKLEKHNILKIFLIINRIRVDMIKKGDMIDIDNIIDIVSVPLIGAVPDEDDVISSNNKGVPIVRKNKSRAGQAYFNIAKRITGIKVPILQDERRGFFKRLSSFFNTI